MEPEGSLPHAQVPTTCPYPEPHQSRPCPHSNSWNQFAPIYAWVFQVVSFSQVCPPKSCMHLFCLPYVLHSLSISFFLIWSPEWYLVITDHKAPRYVVFSAPCYLVHLRPKYIPQFPILKQPHPTFLPQCEWPNINTGYCSEKHISYLIRNLVSSVAS